MEAPIRSAGFDYVGVPKPTKENISATAKLHSDMHEMEPRKQVAKEVWLIMPYTDCVYVYVYTHPHPHHI